MSGKGKSLIGYAVIVNSLQIALCFIIYFLRKFAVVDFSLTQGFLFVAELLIWLICAGASSLGLGLKKIKHAFLYTVIALLPIMIITAVSAAVGHFGDAEAVNWTEYFFLGSAANFWHKPALILSVIIDDSAYMIFSVNIVILFTASMIGANYGMILNNAKSNGKKIVKKKRMKKKAPVKKASAKNGEPAVEVQKKEAKKSVDTPENIK